MRKVIVAIGYVFFVLFVVNAASADLLCVKKKNKVKNNKVNLTKALRTTTEATCPKGFSQVLDVSAFKGDTGATGAKGTVNLSSCINEIVTGEVCPEGDVCDTTLGCGNPGSNGSQLDDYMISHAFSMSNEAAYVVSKVLIVPVGKEYPTGLTISSTSEDTWGSHTPTLAIICCLPQ